MHIHYIQAFIISRSLLIRKTSIKLKSSLIKLGHKPWRGREGNWACDPKVFKPIKVKILELR